MRLPSLFLLATLATGPTFAQAPSTNAVAMDAGGRHACAVTAGGYVKCWGYNAYGQVGDGTNHNSRFVPVDVAGAGTPVAAVALGGFHSCAVTTSGGALCWGNNFDGELGDGTVVDRLTPVGVSGLGSGVAAVALGGYHSCALSVDGGVKCWGYNGDGQVGDGTTVTRRTPVPVSGLGSGVVAITAGNKHSCALTSGGGVKCWGRNESGQLGDGTTAQRVIPVDVAGLGSGVTAIAAGSEHSCALTVAGGVKCWGENDDGALGDGTTIDRPIPTNVTGLGDGVAAIAAGWRNGCALTAAGGVKCWGDNGSGQVGDGTTTERTSPTDVVGLANGAIAIAAGDSYACALVAGGGVACWGENYAGQLGDDTTTMRKTPVSTSTLGMGRGAYQGLWWNAPAGSESGWGINLNHQKDTIFATWFTYGLDGKPLWMVVAAVRSAPGVYSGTLYTGTGPPYDAVPFDPAGVAPIEVGTATFTFTGSNNATFAYTVNGIAQTKNITRELFAAPVPTCAWGGMIEPALAANFQDLWWAAPAESESGWGVNFTHQGEVIFASWFTYGLDRKPLWMVAAAGRTGPGVYSGKLYTGTGPPFNAVPFDPAQVVASEVGTVAITFGAGNVAKFAYKIDGTDQFKTITRQLFEPPGTLCR